MTQTATPASPPSLVVVLAAGEGTRMKSYLAKVLHPVLGKPILGHVMDAVYQTNPQNVVVVIGHQRERVASYLAREYPHALTAVQNEQNGTGHAVRCALDAMSGIGVDLAHGCVVTLAGDTPLLTAQTLEALVAAHHDRSAAVTVLTAELPDATGYGRIVRDADGDLLGIVEHKDATAEQLRIQEINSGLFAFDAQVLRDVLGRLRTDNSQGEEYLTDVLGIARQDGLPVAGYVASDADEVHGINDRVQLAAASAMLRDRVNNAHMRSGVSIIDPATTWIEVGAVIEQDAIIERNTHINSGCHIGSFAVIGPDTTLVDSRIGERAHVLRSFCTEVELAPRASVGPFSYLRPGTRLDQDSRVGAFCETKKAIIGAGSKVPHLSYVGDAQIGVGVNIGAATVFVNYDGVDKHPTVVGDHVRVGSDTMLVAPVTVGDGAYTAAGSVVTSDVPPGAIAIGRGRQVNIEGWVQRSRPGSASAIAAEQALAAADGAAAADPGADNG
ncbi:MAG: bifunctional UDP-N-acetylglucosamine diphosphorylase/glucosamine-1-phosphate N-acetyltransferase GlmU [Actinomycetes bacterium]